MTAGLQSLWPVGMMGMSLARGGDVFFTWRLLGLWRIERQLDIRSEGRDHTENRNYVTVQHLKSWQRLEANASYFLHRFAYGFRSNNGFPSREDTSPSRTPKTTASTSTSGIQPSLRLPAKTGPLLSSYTVAASNTAEEELTSSTTANTRPPCGTSWSWCPRTASACSAS